MLRSVKNSRRSVDGRAVLYRYYDNNSYLLYVGIAWDEPIRRNDHLSGDIWGPDIQTITVTYFANRETASVMERNAVRAEKPLWNTNYNRAPGEPKRQSQRPVPLLTIYSDLTPDAQAVAVLLVKCGRRELTISAGDFALAANCRAPLSECYRRLRLAAMLLKHRAWIHEFERRDVAFSVTIFDRTNRLQSYDERFGVLTQSLDSPT